MSRKGMQQRCWKHDYCSPSFYMITVVTEPRRECLGALNSAPGAGAGTVPGSVPVAAPGLGSVPVAAPALGSVLAAAPALGSVLAAAPAAKLWEKGFQDSILLRRAQLKSMAKYIADNPRRLAEKRANPELFTVVTPGSVNPAPGAGAGTVPGSVPVAAPATGPCPMIGNRYLLEHPLKQQVQISRSISAAELAAKKEELLYLAKHGSVLVSPCISPGEKEIAHAALDAGYPLIVLLENGFPPIYKPPGRYFDACAAGKLLMLAPFPYHRRKQTITREQCLILNDWANTIAAC